MGRIVVGIDGSEGALGALRWALDEAALRVGTRGRGGFRGGLLLGSECQRVVTHRPCPVVTVVPEES